MRWMNRMPCMLILALAGCAGSPPAASPDPLGSMPDDLSLDVTVMTGRDVPARSETHLRPGRFVLYADGSLHYGSERRRGTDWVPPFVRTLSRQQLAEVWALSRQIGFADPANADPVLNFDLLRPTAGRRVYLIAYTGNDRYWNFARSTEATQDPDPAVTRLVRALAQLAWATDLPPERTIVPPRRYDFGPDPYARFRNPPPASP